MVTVRPRWLLHKQSRWRIMSARRNRARRRSVKTVAISKVMMNLWSSLVTIFRNLCGWAMMVRLSLPISVMSSMLRLGNQSLPPREAIRKWSRSESISWSDSNRRMVTVLLPWLLRGKVHPKHKNPSLVNITNTSLTVETRSDRPSKVNQCNRTWLQ